MTGAAMTGAELDPFLDLAVRLADAVRPVVLKSFRSALVVEAKADRSPVTAADREAETVLRDMISEAFPEHGIVGEEFGENNAEAEHVWVLDPIDGTQSFVTGKPLFATLIALVRHGEPVLGVIDAAAVDERWVGAKDRPTTFNGAPVHCRPCADLADAWLYATSPHMFPAGDFEAFERLRKRCRRAVYGAESCAYGYLAGGLVDLVCESTMKPYDYFALVPVVEGAGGVISDWRGRRLGFESDGRVLAAGDSRLHATALECLAA